jgi:formamidopyrimidine-DNA glycosylase
LNRCRFRDDRLATLLQDIEDEPIHDRLLVIFDNGNHLAYSDPRMFGRIGLAQDPHLLSKEKGLGPDAPNLNPTVFLELMQKRRGIIKPALLDQHIMAWVWATSMMMRLFFRLASVPKARVL